MGWVLPSKGFKGGLDAFAGNFGKGFADGNAGDALAVLESGLVCLESSVAFSTFKSITQCLSSTVHV